MEVAEVVAISAGFLSDELQRKQMFLSLKLVVQNALLTLRRLETSTFQLRLKLPLKETKAVKADHWVR